jgi:hypothetical protein
MDTPIINPWIFYFIGFVDPFIKVINAFGWIASFLGAISLGLSFLPPDFWDNAELAKNNLRRLTKFLWVGVPLLLMSVVIPSSNTICKMMVANQITPKNIEIIMKSGKDIKDELKKDIFDLINEVNKDKK